MKYQDLFSFENEKKKSKLSSALVVIGALRVNTYIRTTFERQNICL